MALGISFESNHAVMCASGYGCPGIWERKIKKQRFMKDIDTWLRNTIPASCECSRRRPVLTPSLPPLIRASAF